jgi:hypothetical protein
VPQGKYIQVTFTHEAHKDDVYLWENIGSYVGHVLSYDEIDDHHPITIRWYNRDIDQQKLMTPRYSDGKEVEFFMEQTDYFDHEATDLECIFFTATFSNVSANEFRVLSDAEIPEGLKEKEKEFVNLTKQAALASKYRKWAMQRS